MVTSKISIKQKILQVLSKWTRIIWEENYLKEISLPLTTSYSIAFRDKGRKGSFQRNSEMHTRYSHFLKTKGNAHKK